MIEAGWWRSNRKSPADTYEIFSFADEAQCNALGASAGVGSGSLRKFAFGKAHKGHSGEFRSTNMKRAPFWETFVERLQLK